MVIKLTKKDLPYSHWELLDIDLDTRLRIVPERGGLITEWKSNGREILYFDSERFSQKGKSVRGGIPILFPICGSLPGNCLPLANGNFLIKQHGFARDSNWEMKLIDDQSSFLLRLLDNQLTRSIYPYSFLIDIKVRIEENALNFIIMIHNRSQEKMPYSFGLHPYFHVNDLEKTKIEGIAPACINHLNMMKSQTSKQLADLTKGVDFICGPSKSVVLVDSLEGRRIHLQHQEPMDLTVVWTDPPRQMVCLEPWTSPRESLINGERLLLLEAGGVQMLNCRFLID